MKQTLITLLAAVAFIMQHSAETHSQQSANSTSFNRLEVRQFGVMPDGELIHQYTLRNVNGVELKLIEYGATMTAINLPRKGLEHLNVIAGEETLEPYLKGYPAGSVIGRFANRIAHAKFSIGNTEYEVTRNTGPYSWWSQGVCQSGMVCGSVARYKRQRCSAPDIQGCRRGRRFPRQFDGACDLFAQ